MTFKKALDSLPADQRDAILVVYEWGTPYAEAAERMGITTAKVRQLLHMALVSLKESIGNDAFNEWSNTLEEKGVGQDELDSLFDYKSLRSSVEITTPLSPLSLMIDPGTASPEEIGELLAEISKLYRLVGGSGLTFTPAGVAVREVVE